MGGNGGLSFITLSYLKDVQKTSRSCCWVLCCQWDTNYAPSSSRQDSNLALCCDMPFNQHAVSISLVNFVEVTGFSDTSVYTLYVTLQPVWICFYCSIPRFSRGTSHSWSILQFTWHQHKSCTRMYPGRWQWNITSLWFWSCFTCGWAEVLYCKLILQVLLFVCCTDNSTAVWQLVWDWKFSQWCC